MSPNSVWTQAHLDALERSLDNCRANVTMYQQAAVNLPFEDKLLVTQLDLGIIVLLLTSTATQTIDRVALSRTERAMGAVKVSAKPFHDIKIPLDTPLNSISAAVRDQKRHITEDWYSLFTPALTAEEARLNQSGASIECSIVEPLVHDGASFGALIFSYFQPHSRLSRQHREFGERYAALVARLWPAHSL